MASTSTKPGPTPPPPPPPSSPARTPYARHRTQRDSQPARRRERARLWPALALARRRGSSSPALSLREPSAPPVARNALPLSVSPRSHSPPARLPRHRSGYNYNHRHDGELARRLAPGTTGWRGRIWRRVLGAAATGQGVCAAGRESQRERRRANHRCGSLLSVSWRGNRLQAPWGLPAWRRLLARWPRSQATGHGVHSLGSPYFPTPATTPTALMPWGRRLGARSLLSPFSIPTSCLMNRVCSMKCNSNMLALQTFLLCAQVV